MSVADKQLFLSRISQSFGSQLTVNERDKLMSIISSEISNYNVDFSGSYNYDRTDEIMREFLSTKSIEGKAQKTLERYKYILHRFFDYITVPVDGINVYHIRRYIQYMKDNGNSDVTLEGYRAIIVGFFKWCFNEGLLQSNSIANFSSIKCEKKVKLPFSDTDIELMKEYSDNVRDKAIICFLLSTGCRIGEVCSLNKIDVNFDDKEVIVLGKGNKRRKVYFDDYTSLLLKRYIDSRGDKYSALFIGKGTDRITPHGVRFMLKRLETICGVENIHPHRFRRTLATNLINRGMVIQEVAKILGHEKIETTMKYVYISDENLKNNYNQMI